MNDSKTAIRFLALAIGLYLIWYVIYDLWLLNDGRLDEWLTMNVTNLSGKLLSILGFSAASSNYLVYLNGEEAVRVGHSCNGLVLYALFAGFVIAFPGPLKAKLLYIPLGIFIIYFLNISRVVCLALNSYYSQETLHFNHKYTFSFVVYAVIFGLWMLWAKKFSTPILNENTPETPAIR